MALSSIAGFKLEAEPDTNMLFLGLEPGYFKQLSDYLQANDVLVTGQRWVIHKDINDSDIERLISLCQQFAVDHG
jgi:threonine aldolase